MAAFRDEVVFRRPLRSRVTAIGRFGEVEALWDDLLLRGTRQPAFRIVRAGTNAPGRDVTRAAGIGDHQLSDLVSPNQVVARYRQGETVVLQGLHHTNPQLARLANNLALALDHPVQVNAYLSPSAARGLDLHFDYHDVFVVQLGGSKRWRVWPPLARTTDPVRAGHRIAAPRRDELGEPLLDITMGAGDCLYLPRGYPHAAETVDHHSDHLTIGLVAVTWQWVLRRAIDAEVAAGRLTGALPVGLLEPGGAASNLALGIGGWGELVQPASLRQWMAREIWRRQPVTRLRPRTPPAPGSRRLTVTPGPLLWLTIDAGRAVLGLGGLVLDLPLEAHDFLSGLLDTECPFVVDSLKGLDPGSRAVVVRRLLAEGVLVDVD